MNERALERKRAADRERQAKRRVRSDSGFHCFSGEIAREDVEMLITLGFTDAIEARDHKKLGAAIADVLDCLRRGMLNTDGVNPFK